MRPRQTAGRARSWLARPAPHRPQKSINTERHQHDYSRSRCLSVESANSPKASSLVVLRYFLGQRGKRDACQLTALSDQSVPQWPSEDLARTASPGAHPKCTPLRDRVSQ